ncbi:hypothetical protein G6F30_012992 [Rhizopus arrhizus]|nr:hypothetical protein G6F30_012992 [Rhizopus arrhizus]KAG1257395.1 hypothetical protein G6F65_015932 [Rhizopus arrhizus]KAG1401246.1 hypothetical protein G6F59_013070 [Rhizopus arrhizus]
MLWSAITYAGVGWMCKINGNMDKELYKEILEDELERTIGYGVNKLGFERHQVIFQHDNDPKHTSKVVKEYLQKQSHNFLQWPAQSSDLNPIENMWSLLKRRLNDYETAPKGMNELYERVTKYKDQGVYNNYPNCEYLLQQQYMSEEEDMYNDETMDKVEEILLEQNPDRTTPFTEKERMSVLCTKTIDYFEVRVPKYRSPVLRIHKIIVTLF